MLFRAQADGASHQTPLVYASLISLAQNSARNAIPIAQVDYIGLQLAIGMQDYAIGLRTSTDANTLHQSHLRISDSKAVTE